jgi:hypothetical protein
MARVGRMTGPRYNLPQQIPAWQGSTSHSYQLDGAASVPDQEVPDLHVTIEGVIAKGTRSCAGTRGAGLARTHKKNRDQRRRDLTVGSR